MSITTGKDWLLTIDDEPLGDISDLQLTLRDNDYTPSITVCEGSPVMQDYLKMLEALRRSAREAEISLIMFGESLQYVDFPFENIVNERIDYMFDGRRFAILDEPVLKKPNNKPYYRQFEKRSKKL